MKHTFSNNELKDKLKQQMRFLKTSCELFDKGNTEEAIRLSTSIRILVHDTKNSKSLLNQINKKNMKFYDTSSRFSSSNLLTYQGLLHMKIGPNETEVIARLDNPPPERSIKKVKFDKWWEEIIVITDENKKRFYRKDLVLYAADKEGGAHVDSQIDEDYYNLSIAESFGWRIINGDQESNFNNPILQSIRQIAYELEKSIIDEFPEIK